MNKDMGKRIGCAALAAQMILTPVAQAAVPLRTLSLTDGQQVIESQSAWRLERFLLAKAQNATLKRDSFSHVNLSMPHYGDGNRQMSEGSKAQMISAEMMTVETTVTDPIPVLTPDPVIVSKETAIADEGAVPTKEIEQDSTLPVDEAALHDELLSGQVTNPDIEEAPDETTVPDTESDGIVLPPDVTTTPDTTLSPEETTAPDADLATDGETEQDVILSPGVATTPDMEIDSEKTELPDTSMEGETGTNTDSSLDVGPAMDPEVPSDGEMPSEEGMPSEVPEESNVDKVVQPPEASTFEAVPYSEPPYQFGAPLEQLIAIFGMGSKYGPGEDSYINADAEYSFEGEWYNKRYPYPPDADPLFYGDPVAIYAQGFEALYSPPDWDWDWNADTTFVWNDSEGKTYFNGVLMTEVDFPRLPNKKFSGEWYIYDSVNPGISGGDKEFLDEYGMPYSDYQTLIGDIYLKCEYDPSRDTVRFDKSTPVDDYWIYVDGWYYLPIVGKWDLSDDATMTGITLNAVSSVDELNGASQPIYVVSDDTALEDFTKMTAAQLGSEENKKNYLVDPTKELSSGQDRYYVRVPERVEKLTFDLRTFEPDSTVEIKVSYGLKTTATYTSDQLQHDVTAKYPLNSETNPARGQWTSKTDVTIPLDCSSESVKYNEVTITVTAPDGTKKVYTIYVQRLAKARMVLNPGNTPYGMIDRESSMNDDQKAKAKQAFLNNRYKFTYGDAANIPQSEINNNGFIQQDGYHENAWGVTEVPTYKNVDLDPGAIVVYQNTSFEEPGFCLYDGLGEEHIGATGIDVNWKLELSLVDKLGPKSARDDAEDGTLDRSGAGNVDNVSLVGYNVKPGVYTLQYTYTDLYDETVYCDEGFARTVVVLPLRGDVDMDGAVTAADGVALQQLLKEGYFNDVVNWTSRDVTKYLYYFRVCDVDGIHPGGYVDTEDVNKLLGTYNTVLKGKECNYFYIPLAGESGKTKSPAVESQAPDKAIIGLKYLGVGTDPDKLDTTANVDYTPEAPEVFWMEAQLSQSAMLPAELKGSLDSLTISFTYDGAYVAPYLPSDVGSWEDYIISQNPQWAGWTVRSSGYDITPVEHEFKAVSGLDQNVGSNPKELRFSVTPPVGTSLTLTDLETSGILKVPFQMKGFPTGKANDDSKLIELTLGMRDLALATTTGSATWNNGQEAESVTSVTANLANLIAYGKSEATPLGVDNSPCYIVHIQGTTDNPVYGSTFRSNEYGDNKGDKEYLPKGPVGTISLTSGKLPAGVSYNEQFGYFTGTPKEAGSFDFTLTGSNVPFRLVVDRRVLDLTVQDVTKFYGETATTKQTFTYDPTQIDPLDLADGKSNTGTESDLAALLEGYERPTINLVTSITDRTSVKTDTVPGDYTVLIQGGKSKNYSFRFVQGYDKDETHPEVGTAKLEILKRPIFVDKVTKDPLTTLWANAGIIRNLTGTAEYDTTGETAKTEFAVADMTKFIDTNGYYVDPVTKKAVAPLTATTGIIGKDILELTFRFDVIKNSNDSTGEFVLTTGDKESRDAEVTSVSLTDGKGQNKYYTLAQTTPKDNKATATILKRQTTKIELGHKPGNVKYEYGQELMWDQFILNVYYEDMKNDTPAYEQMGNANDTAAQLEKVGITLHWVTGDKVIPDENSPKVKDGEELNVKAHNGKYICITGMTGKENTPTRIWVGPYTVTAKTLTLSLQGKTRYYGEEVTDWTVLYDHSQLASWDQTAFPNTTGTIADLVGLPGYQKPEIEAVLGGAPGSQPVTKTTDVGTYYALITIPNCDNYKFNYLCTTPTGGTSTRNDFGYAPLVIEQRPILVTKIISSAGSLFHDSDTYIIETVKATVGGGAEGFQAQLPLDGVTYFNADGTSYSLASGMTLSKDAVCFGDIVTLSYRGTFKTDNPTKNYFEMNGQEHKKQPVTVTELKLLENGKNDNSNYRLIYPNWNAAEQGWAGATVNDSVAEGDIYRRRILGFEVISAPKRTNYVYGETLRLDGLQVRIWYEGSDGDDTKVETVKYVQEHLGTVWKDTFTDRGLTISWGVTEGPVATNRQQLSVAAHNGKKLVITGPQYPGETAKVQTVSTPITVQKRELTLKVKDIPNKYYGEEIDTYEFTFNVNQLADWDKTVLGAVTAEGAASALDVPATSAALSLINAPYEDGDPKNEYIGPKFSTEVEKKTRVQDNPYPLELSGGSMANYAFKMEQGGITVVKRPIRVSEILKNPVYSISETARGKAHTTTCYQGELGNVSYNDLRLGLQPGLGLKGDALVQGDGIGIRMRVSYLTFGFSPFPDGAVEKEENVTTWNFSLLEGGDNENYELMGNFSSATSPNALTATGVVHKKDIRSISIFQQPSKSTYTYGEALDLNGLLVRVTYDDGSIVTASPEALEGVYINYWDDPKNLPSIGDLPGVVGTHPAATGDHLTIAEDSSGFAQNGKYLLISARVRPTESFITPVVTNAPIKVNPLELRYTLSAEDKDYDGNKEAVGTIMLTNVYPGDKVWVKNGTDYTNHPLPGNYEFQSGDYGNGITFTFVDKNVKYRVSDPENDIFVDVSDMTVRVTKIAIDGKDQKNYHINTEVTENTPQISGRDKAPVAKILPIHRDVPDIKIDLWVDEHTNTVTVLPDRLASDFENPNDKKDKNDRLHYEYALVYYDKDGNWVQTEYQDSEYFGGEQVKVEIPDFKPDGTPVERPEGTGGGQTVLAGDKDFGSRDELPRGIYVGALVRLSQTNNYEASTFTSSVKDYDNDGVIADDSELQAAFQAASAYMDTVQPPIPEKGTDRLPERVKGPVAKTYTYRIDLVSTLERNGTGKEKVLVPILEEVWFTDTAEFSADKDLSRLIENLQPVRYFSYSWDEEESVKVDFPLKLDAPIEVELPVKQADGTTVKVKTVMNADDTIRLYVPVYKSGGGGAYIVPESVYIEPDGLTLKLDDDPVKLEAVISPTNATIKSVTWWSSDENVVTVSRNGTVTVVGVGTATITVRTQNGLTYSIEVEVVEEKKPQLPYEETMFNAGYTGSFMGLFDGRFEPERTMTRQELTVLMAHFFQMMEGREARIPGEYIDIPENAEYMEAIRTLDQWGIVNGIGENLYAPDRPATRAEISIILCRMLDLPIGTDPDESHAFIDAGPEDTWAWAYIDALAKAGITKGTGDDAYNPNRVLTRAEVAVFVTRILATKIDKDAGELIIPTDVTEEHWAYESIIRAVNSGAVLLIPEND